MIWTTIALLAAKAVSTEDPKVDAGSLRSLTQYVHHAKERMAELRREGKEDTEEFEEYEEQAEFYGMRQHLLHVRAWPNDKIDREAYREAAKQRDAMPPVNSPAFAGTSWTFFGARNQEPAGNISAPVAGRVNAVKHSPGDPGNDFWVAAGTGGIFKTTDNANNFTALSTSWPFSYTSDVEVDPTNSNRVYVATGDFPGWWGYGYGIMRSSNGGSTWTSELVTQLDGCEVSDILVDPDNPAIVYAGAGRGTEDADGMGLWKSTDYGNTWTRVLDGSQTGGVSSVAASISSGGVRNLYAGTMNGRIYTSSNGFVNVDYTLHPSAFGEPIALATSTTSRDTVYAACMAEGRVKKSTDAGQAFSNITGSGLTWNQTNFNYLFGVLNTMSNGSGSDILVFGMTEFFALLPGAGSWGTPFGASGTRTLHVDHHGFDRHPTLKNFALISNDGGVYRISYLAGFGFTLDNLNLSLRNTEHVHASAAPSIDPDYCMTGMWHLGVGQSTGDPWVWHQRYGGDGMYSIIHDTLPSTQMATIQGMWSSSSDIGIAATRDYWVNSTVLTTTYNLANESFGFISPMDEITTELGAVYFAGETLYKVRYTSSGVTWTKNIGGIDISASAGENAMSIDSMNNTTKGVYIGTNFGRVFGALDPTLGASMIKDYSTPVTCVSTNPSDFDEVLIALGNQGAPGDTGALWEITDWSNILLRQERDRSGTGLTALPSTGVNWVERDPYDPVNTWYAATDLGVFYTEDRGGHWYNATGSLGLPNVMCLHLVAKDGYLYVSTFGRGMWRMALRAAKPKVTSFDISQTFVTGGNPITGTVTLDQVAGPGGVEVTVTTSDAGVSPGMVIVPEGSTSLTWNLGTTQVSSHRTVTVTCSANGGQASDSILVNEVSVLSLELDTNITAGGDFNGIVYLDRAAPQGGVTVDLVASPSVAVTIPSQITISAGSAFRQFTGTTALTPQDRNVAIQATKFGSGVQSSMVVLGLYMTSMSVNPSSLYNTDGFFVNVGLNRAASENGFPLSAISGVPSAATVISPFSVGANLSSGNTVGQSFYVAQDTNVGIRVTGPYGDYLEDTLLVEHLGFTGITCDPNPVIGGNPVTLRVRLDRTVARATRVYLQSSDSAILGVPVFGTVPVGASSVDLVGTTFTVLSPKQVSVEVRLKNAPGDPPSAVTNVDVVPPSFLVPPSSFTVSLGRKDAGDVVSLRSTDGNVLRVCKFIVPNSVVPPINVTVDGTSSVTSAATLQWLFASRMQHAGAFSQTLEFWNWQASTWDTTDRRTDSVTTTLVERSLAGTGSLARLLDPATGNLRCRYTVKSTGPTAVSAWCHETDRAPWLLGY